MTGAPGAAEGTWPGASTYPGIQQGGRTGSYPREFSVAPPITPRCGRMAAGVEWSSRPVVLHPDGLLEAFR